MTEKMKLDDLLNDLEILLVDPFQGILINTLKKDFFEEYKDFDTITAWECFVDEVNRVNSLVELHDFLVDNLDEIKKVVEKND